MPYQTLSDLTGKKYGSLSVESLTSSSPRKYSVRCDKCGSSWNELHSTLQTRLNSGLLPECRNSACRKGTLKIEQNAREWHQEDARRERVKAQREADAIAAKKAKDLALELESNAKKLAILERERVKNSRDDFQVDEAVRNAKMTQDQANRFNAESAAAFVDATPEYYPCDENHQTLCDYLERNGCQIANQATWSKAFWRLRELGLLREWPTPEPEPEPVPSMEHEGYPVPRQPTIQYVDAWDPDTGLPIKLTPHQLDRLPSWELKKVLRIPTAPVSRQREV